MQPRQPSPPPGEDNVLIAHHPDAERVVFTLLRGATQMVIGRAPASDVCLGWDHEVSRTHAQLERLGTAWTIVDDGISTNGTFVNGERLTGRRRLEDGDIVRAGRTDLIYRAPALDAGAATVLPERGIPITLSPAQRRVMLALARPYGSGSAFPVPASNQAIADELHISLEAVKGHLRVLFGKFAIGDVPQNQKRARLVERALHQGVISVHELG